MIKREREGDKIRKHIYLADVARHMLSLNTDGSAAAQSDVFYKLLCWRGSILSIDKRILKYSNSKTAQEIA